MTFIMIEKVLKRGYVTKQRKQLIKNTPTADEGGDEHGSGHSFPEANRGEGVNGDSRIPKSL